MTLTEFLLARIAEDEALARAAIDDDQGQDGGFEDAFDKLTTQFRPRFGEAAARMIVWNTPRRVLAECAAKRAILDEYDGLTFESRSVMDSWEPYRSVMRTVLFQMAGVYRDHPDFNQNWLA